MESCRVILLILIHETLVFELQIETTFFFLSVRSLQFLENLKS